MDIGLAVVMLVVPVRECDAGPALLVVPVREYDAGCPSEGMERDDGVRSRRQSRPSHEVEDGDEVGQHQLPKCSQAEHS